MKVQYILQIKYGDNWVDNKTSDTLIGIKREQAELNRTRQCINRIVKRTEEIIG